MPCLRTYKAANCMLKLIPALTEALQEGIELRISANDDRSQCQLHDGRLLNTAVRTAG